MNWATRRKLITVLLLIGVFILIVLLPLFLVFYKAPTCTDGVKNQDEYGVDCGGSCPKICQISYIAPEVKWVRYDYVAPGIYNVGAYIINYNLNSEVKKAGYVFHIYDKEGVEVETRKGSLYIPANRNVIAFEHSIQTSKKEISKVTFDFLPNYEWTKTDGSSYKIVKADESFNVDDSSTSWSVKLKNNEIKEIFNVKVYAILYDINKNVIGLSQSVVDSIWPNDYADVEFTWNSSKKDVAEKELIVVTQ